MRDGPGGTTGKTRPETGLHGVFVAVAVLFLLALARGVADLGPPPAKPPVIAMVALPPSLLLPAKPPADERGLEPVRLAAPRDPVDASPGGVVRPPAVASTAPALVAAVFPDPLVPPARSPRVPEPPAAAAWELPVPAAAAVHADIVPDERTLVLARVEHLDQHFGHIAHAFDHTADLALPVPRLFLGSLPADMHDVADPQDRKRLFLQAMLPLVLRANETIAEDRRRLEAMRAWVASGGLLSSAGRRFLEDLAGRYGLASIDFDELARRVDVVPVSLALAQGALESGWGTSRFARDYNAVFGEYVWRTDHASAPAGGEAAAQYLIRPFGMLYHSVGAYMRNLNTHRAYTEFRHRRATAREEGRPPRGLDLAPTLLRYSELGPLYVKRVQGLIRANRLDRLETVRLGAPAVAGG